MPDTVHMFSGGDQELMFLENLKTQPNDWYYRFHEISYNYNSLGHRSKNIDELDLDNYILFTGCSHTEGVGLELEKTFPYVTANALKMDYYNLALGGTGIDVMTHNLVIWANTVPKLPKALVILWPQPVRFSIVNSYPIFPKIQSFLPGNTPNSDYDRFMVLGEELRFFKSVQAMNTVLIENTYSRTKIINLYNIPFCDKARDLSHGGIETNKSISDQVISHFN